MDKSFRLILFEAGEYHLIQNVWQIKKLEDVTVLDHAIHAVFSLLVTAISMSFALWLAVLADRVIKGADGYRTLLIWPYAVAPAIAGVLWLFLFNPSIPMLPWYQARFGYHWNHTLHGGEAMTLVVMASAWK